MTYPSYYYYDYYYLDYEIAFLKLIEKVTNGAMIEINDTGTSLYYRPGLLVGGQIEFEAPLSRGLGYYLEMLLPLAPFSKYPWQLKLSGVTAGDDLDPSVRSARSLSLIMTTTTTTTIFILFLSLLVQVDLIRFLSLTALKAFGVSAELDIKILKRGAQPEGGGLVLLTCSPVKALRPIRSLEPGKMKRIRGLA